MIQNKQKNPHKLASIYSKNLKNLSCCNALFKEVTKIKMALAFKKIC
ncbi:hypothetical protein HPHPP13_0259 [Helicobacter pylori Hp P-13]|uniref:Uncharacterized protein n=1 Tax=Helicobacter pylori Hp P-13b TaxID=992107 RepID=A0ABC9QT04_HELPX|nr:hypothetical protein HPHPP13_0259 [Helicobacter pylori Hp P-13]EJC33581.1 hypothetical protein HPHPP13B_0254 [Helicobacter pylori Hp P-13b]